MNACEQKFPIILTWRTLHISPLPTGAIRQSFWPYRCVSKHQILSDIEPAWEFCLARQHLSAIAYAKILVVYTLYKSLFSFFSVQCIWDWWFFDSLYIHTGTDHTTPASVVLSLRSFLSPKFQVAVVGSLENCMENFNVIVHSGENAAVASLSDKSTITLQCLIIRTL